MSTEPFTDEILSAIIDGEADDETVAAVAADPAATARLVQLRGAVDHVAVPVPDATPERRSASIAAAMAAATPASPEVTSLAAARHERTAKAPAKTESTRQWFVLAAAAIALVVAIPLALQLRSDNGDDTATSADSSAEAPDSVSRSLDAVDDAADDSDSADAAGDEDAASDDVVSEAMEEELADLGVSGDDAMDESEDAEADAAFDEPADQVTATTAASANTEAPADTETPTISPADALADAISVNSLDVLESSLAVNGVITPTLTLDVVIGAVVEAGLSPDCAESLETTNGPEFALALLSEGGADRQLLILQFDEAGNATTLDAEDCAQLG